MNHKSRLSGTPPLAAGEVTVSAAGEGSRGSGDVLDDVETVAISITKLKKLPSPGPESPTSPASGRGDDLLPPLPSGRGQLPSPLVPRDPAKGRVSTAGESPRLWTYHLCLLMVLTGASSSLAQEPEILVQLLDRDEIFVGESAHYQVLLNHFDESATPDMPTSPDYSVKLIRKSLANSVHQTSNGFQTTRIVRRGPQFVYELTPKRPGELVIAGPTATARGKKVQGEPVSLRVLDAGEQDLVRLLLTSDRPVVYPTQSFAVRLELLVKGLPDTAADQDPLTVQPLPVLTLPWTNDDELGDSIEPVKPRERWLGEFVASDGKGVSINNLQRKTDLITGLFGGDPFDILTRDSFGRRRNPRLAFRPSATRVLDADSQGRQVEYWKYVFERNFVARESGSYEFGPVTLKGTFGSRIDPRGRLEGESVYALAAPITVSVNQPPLAGRPANYVGAIGQFTCGARIAPHQAKVGDPMTLSIWLRGSGTLDSAIAPDLQTHSEITEAFKVYDATEETHQDMRTFTYSLRPKHTSVQEFPAVAMAYFDVETEQYTTLRTDALSIEIAAAERLNRADIAVAAGSTTSAAEIEVSAEGIFANNTDVAQLRDETVHPDRWFMGLGGLAGLFLVLVVAKQRVDQRTGDTGLTRRRKAASRARQQIDNVRRRLDSMESSEAADQLGAALVGLVADANNLTQEGLTSRDAVTQLREIQLADDLIGRYGSLLETCDAMRYGTAAGPLEELVQRTSALAEELIISLRQQKCLR